MCPPGSVLMTESCGSELNSCVWFFTQFDLNLVVFLLSVGFPSFFGSANFNKQKTFFGSP